MSELIQYQRDDGIVTLTLNSPETRNPISDDDMIEALLAALERLETDPDARVAILTGAGSAFSSGGNVKKMRERGGIFAGGALDVQQSYRTGIQRIPLQLYELEVPVIAAVNGAAIGAGFDISLMCDIRLASTEAKFGETFLNLGIIPGDGGAWFLPRALGHQRAAELTFTGRIVEAQEALDLGIVLEVVEPEQLLPRARALAERIADRPPQALRAAKRLLRAGQDMSLPRFLDYCAAIQAGCHQTEDHLEALDAFFEKRPGRYQGR